MRSRRTGFVLICLLTCLAVCSCAKSDKTSGPTTGDLVLKTVPAAPAREAGPGQLDGGEAIAEAGIDVDEAEAGQAIIDALVADAKVDFVATYREGGYQIHARRGVVEFQRYLLDDGRVGFVVNTTRSVNPMARQNVDHLPTLPEMLEAGSNPTGFWDRSKPHLTYVSAVDPRLRFLTPETDSYPYAYSRIAAVFDSPDAPDLVINYAPYAGFDNNSGTYGGLGIAESRGLLIVYGTGCKPGIHAGHARLRDIAPTVAKLLNVSPLADGNLLQGQSGRVLDELLTGETAKHVLVINLSGMSDVVFDHLRGAQAERFVIFNELNKKGGRLTHGLIAPFPTADWPCQFTLATGADVGRHGMLDNTFYRRGTRSLHTALLEMSDGEKLMASSLEVETIFEALRRSRSGSDQLMSASLGLLATRGAEVATVVDRGESLLPPVEGLAERLPSLPTFACEAQFAKPLVLDRRVIEAAIRLFAGEQAPQPALAVVSLTGYLTAARRYGPYSLCAAKAAWHQAELIRLLLEILHRGRLESDIALLVVSDHGERGVDLSRSGDVVTYMNGLGFALEPTQRLLYLPVFRVETDLPQPLVVGKKATLRLRCVDADTGEPVAGVQVSVLDPGGGQVHAKTNAAGAVILSVTPVDKRVVLEASHERYNPRRITLVVKAPEGS